MSTIKRRVVYFSVTFDEGGTISHIAPGDPDLDAQGFYKAHAIERLLHNAFNEKMLGVDCVEVIMLENVRDAS